MAVNMDPDPVTRFDVQRGQWGPVRALPILAATGNTQIFTGLCKFMGVNISESSGSAAARVRVYDAADTTHLNVMLASISAVTNGNGGVGSIGDGVLTEQGIVVNVVSGTADVTVYIRHLLMHPE